MTHDHEALLALSEKAPKGPWELRPQKYDDWGVIRASQVEGFPYREIVLVARGWDDEEEKSRARHEGRQPQRCEDISAFVVALVNAYRSGDLIHRSTISEETARAVEGMRERCRALVAAEVARVSAVEADLIAMGGENDSLSYAGQRAALEIMDQAIRALPLEDAGHAER